MRWPRHGAVFPFLVRAAGGVKGRGGGRQTRGMNRLRPERAENLESPQVLARGAEWAGNPSVRRNDEGTRQQTCTGIGHITFMGLGI